MADKLSGRTPIAMTPSGRRRVLKSSEEKMLLDYMNHMARIEYPLTRSQIKTEVIQFVKTDNRPTPFKDGVPGGYILLCNHLCD